MTHLTPFIVRYNILCRKIRCEIFLEKKKQRNYFNLEYEVPHEFEGSTLYNDVDFWLELLHTHPGKKKFNTNVVFRVL